MTPRPDDLPRLLVPGRAKGPVLSLDEGLSFWGGVDPETGRIIDAHHPNHGAALAGTILAMPSSRGSCSGSGTLLSLSLAGAAPAALVFCAPEEVLTLGALVADRVFGRTVPVVRLSRADYDLFCAAERAEITEQGVIFGGMERPFDPVDPAAFPLSPADTAMLEGEKGAAAQLAIQVICAFARIQGAPGLIDVTRGHIDGCLMAGPANLAFAERMVEMGARMRIPTTINAISVDRENWRGQGVTADFGLRASRLADAYVTMGAAPSFTCAPYLLEGGPVAGEPLGWSESNAVIYANSVIGARTAKIPDYLDLFVAMTGRAPASAIYTPAGRAPHCEIAVAWPDGADDLIWPLLGWSVGRLAPDTVPLITGLEQVAAGQDDLRALCAAFGTTSGAPLVQIAGHSPEVPPLRDNAPVYQLTSVDLAAAWSELNTGTAQIDLVAIGSPHATASECRRLAALLDGARTAIPVIVTLGRDVLRALAQDGTLAGLTHAGVRVIPDLCWCSITEPVLPATARTVMTNSGKYAHYAQGLHGRAVRLGSFADCAEAARTGRAPEGPPAWLHP